MRPCAGRSQDAPAQSYCSLPVDEVVRAETIKPPASTNPISIANLSPLGTLRYAKRSLGPEACQSPSPLNSTHQEVVSGIGKDRVMFQAPSLNHLQAVSAKGLEAFRSAQLEVQRGDRLSMFPRSYQLERHLGYKIVSGPALIGW